MLSIEGRRGELKNVVDSLNVSVAAGLLCEAFLRPPSKGKTEKAQVPENVPPEISSVPALEKPVASTTSRADNLW